MKKIIASLLLLSLCLASVLSFSSCDVAGHEHSFKTDWSKDQTYHWHMCEGDQCLEVSDKAEHQWDDGVVSSEPAQGADGEKTFTCKVCGAVRGETLVFEGVEEEDWQASIADQKFDNVTINYIFKDTAGVQDHIVKIADSKVYRYAEITMADGTENSFGMLCEGEEAVQQKSLYLSMFLGFLEDRDNFKYDAEKGIYSSESEITVKIPLEGDGETDYALELMKNGTVKFDEQGRLIEFLCHVDESIYHGGELMGTIGGDVTWTFSDYGETVITEEDTNG